MPPAPKPAETRRNRNPKAHGEWVDIFERRLAEPAWPPLPDACPETQARWDIWRHDPAAAYWSEGDAQMARETLELYEREEQPLSQITARLNLLGLTPRGKRDLRYRICFADWRDTTLDEPEQKGIANLSDERRRRLAGGK